MVRWTIAVRSVRYSTLPALDSSTALATSIVTVPTFGFGILPCGPRMRPRRPTTGIMSGVAMATSKSVKPVLDALGEVLGADDVGAGLLGLAGLVALAKTATLTSLPSPWGSAIVPRSCSSAWRTFSPVRTWTSTDSSNFARLSSLTSRRPRRAWYSRSRSTFARASSVALAVLGHHATTSTPIERAVPAMIFAAWSTSWALRSGSFFSAISRTWACVIVPTLSRLGSPEPFSMPDRLPDQDRGRRRLRDEGERAVLEDRDDHGDRRARCRPASGR